MRLGVSLGYIGMGMGADTLAVAQQADASGYAVAWVAEAYGSDAPTVLAWLAAQTQHIDLGSAVMQIPARSPAMTAMTAATVDHLSSGRFRLGLGVSGPQVSEGWHGVRFAQPLARTAEYVDIVRMALRRERLTYQGRFHTLPLPDGPGKSLRLTIKPGRADLPVYLAAVGPKNLQLAGRIADGLLAIFWSPAHAEDHLAAVDAGRRQRAVDQHCDLGDLPPFDISATVPVCITEDLDAARAAIAPYCALYIGGMGSRRQNFYNALARRMGFVAEAQRIQDLYLDGRPRDAAEAVPLELVDATALIGPPERIADRVRAYAESGVTTLSVAPYARTTQDRLDVVAALPRILQRAGLAQSG